MNKFKFTLSLLVLITLTFSSVTRAQNNAGFAAPHTEKEIARALKVKEKIASRGVGEKARLKVKLQDKTEVSGYVFETNESDFIIADAKTNAKTTIAYREVKQIKGKGLSLAAKIGIGVAIAAGVIVTVVVLADKSLHDALEGR